MGMTHIRSFLYAVLALTRYHATAVQSVHVTFKATEILISLSRRNPCIIYRNVTDAEISSDDDRL